MTARLGASPPGVLHPRARLLDPVARISEILFGLIMALTFTTTLGVTAGREDVRLLVAGAVGCNIAWGLVDAVMFLIAALTERGQETLTLHAVRHAASPADAYRSIAHVVSPVVASTLTNEDFERVRQRLVRAADRPNPALVRDDWLGAVGVFLLVVLSTFPVVLPFLLFSQVTVAIRASNLVAIVMMFAAGYVLARYGGYNPWRTGLGVTLLGSVLVGVAVALGG